jgi:hypothetical protein
MKDEAFLEWYKNAHWGNEDLKECCRRSWNAAIKQALAAPVQSCYCPNCEAMGKELAALKAQPAVPDAFGTREGEHPQYIEGWNDCRAEMLKGMK